MTSGLSRKMGISGEEKAEAKGEPPHELEPDAKGPGLRDWFDDLLKTRDGGRAAAFDTRLGSPMAGGAAHGIARRLRKHGYHLVTDPEGFIVGDSYGPLVRVRSSGRRSGGSPGAGGRPPIELNRLAAGAVPAADLVAQLLAPEGSPTPLLVGLGVPDAEEAEITNLREHVRRSSRAAVVLHADRRLAASALPGAGLTST